MKTTIKYMLLTLFLFIGICVFASDVKDDAVDSLKWMGVPAFWASIIALAITVIGKIIPKKGADWLYQIEMLLHYFNEHTNRLSEEEKESAVEKKKAITFLKDAGINVKKIGLMLLVVIGFGATTFAQSSFFAPKEDAFKKALVKQTRDVGEADATQFLWRGTAAVNATAINVSDEVTESFTGLGFGVSYGKYGMKDDAAWCYWSVNALCFNQIKLGDITDTKMGLGLTFAGWNNLMGIGGAYVDKSFYLLFPVIGISF